MISGVFNDIVSSWTLVPYGKLPCTKPSPKVVDAVPDAGFVEFLTIKAFTLFCLFTLFFGFDFLKVAINFASSFLDKSVPTLNISKILVPEAFVLIENLSDVKTSVTPSSLTKEYLSSSKGKKVSLGPDTTTDVKESVEWFIVTSNDFLIVITEFVKSISLINFLGVSVYKVLSLDFS